MAGAVVLWDGKGVVGVTFLLRGQQYTLSAILKHYEVSLLALWEFIPQKKNHRCCSPMTMPDCEQLCAPLRPSPNLDGQLLDLCYGSDLIAVEFYLFIPLEDRMQGCYHGDVKTL